MLLERQSALERLLQGLHLFRGAVKAIHQLLYLLCVHQRTARLNVDTNLCIEYNAGSWQAICALPDGRLFARYRARKATTPKHALREGEPFQEERSWRWPHAAMKLPTLLTPTFLLAHMRARAVSSMCIHARAHKHVHKHVRQRNACAHARKRASIVLM